MQNENDSVHATIERASRNILSIYSALQWPATIRFVRRKNPYIVKEMNLKDLILLKKCFWKPEELYCKSRKWKSTMEWDKGVKIDKWESKCFTIQIWLFGYLAFCRLA